MVIRKWALFVASLLLAVLPSACGSSTPTAARGGNPPRASTTTEPTVTTTSTTSAPTSIAFQFTDALGWTYSGVVPIASETIQFSVDIGSSPPGQAQIAVAISNTKGVSDVSFSDTNPGRPDGPQLTVQRGQFVEQLPSFQAVMQSLNYNSASYPIGESCDLLFSEEDESGDGLTWYVSCDAAGDYLVLAGDSSVMPQNVAEAVVNLLNRGTFDYVVPFDDGCSVSMPPSGVPSVDPSSCASMLSVTGG